jgi:2-iminobutanoate/2-iminopropanoate deaminase
MGKKIISTKNAPAAIGPYSQAVVAGNLIFTSGQLPIDPANGQLINDDVKKAAERSMENIKAILEAADSSLDKVIKTVIYLKDMNDFAAVNEVYSRYFKSNEPARSCVQVAKLPKDGLLEIEAIAII